MVPHPHLLMAVEVARIVASADILVPLVLGFVIPFWGFLLAPPLLAVVYALKARRTEDL